MNVNQLDIQDIRPIENALSITTVSRNALYQVVPTSPCFRTITFQYAKRSIPIIFAITYVALVDGATNAPHTFTEIIN